MAITTGPIQFTVPNPGGDNGIWGSLLNSFFSFLDSCLYASREERAWNVTGGGRMRWETSGNTLSFSEDIVFRSPYTAFTFTIPTSLSPITMPTNGQVAFCSLTRRPSVNTVASTISVISAGTLPNTQAALDSNYFVFAQRIGAGVSGKLLLPWARKILFPGDEAYLNIEQTLFEKLATSRRPSFQFFSLTQINVGAGTASLNGPYPSCAIINGKLYVNYGTVSCILSGTGLGGLDTGALAANTTYYLYAVPNGDGFGLVASLVAPSGVGPAGFTNAWTYLGAFCTEPASAALVPFRSYDGQYKASKSLVQIASTAAIVPTAFNVTRVPVWADHIYVSLRMTGTVANLIGRISPTNDANGESLSVQNPVINQLVRESGEVPIVELNAGVPRTYVFSSAATATTSALLFGWDEDLMQFR